MVHLTCIKIGKECFMNTDKDIERCEYICLHKEVIDQVLSNLPKETQLYDLAELFKIFGDTTRIKILYVLFQAEMCVCDIAQLLNMSQSAISHQLRILKQAKLVKSKRDGKTIFIHCLIHM